MASVNQTRPHCVNQMGKTHSKPLAARHGRGTAWARHPMCELALRHKFVRRLSCLQNSMYILSPLAINVSLCDKSMEREYAGKDHLEDTSVDGAITLVPSLKCPMSSQTRQFSPFFQVRYRAVIDTLHYNVWYSFSISTGHLVFAFKLWRLREIYLQGPAENPDDF